jgi:PhzF family phenazine biosynthesis protein
MPAESSRTSARFAQVDVFTTRPGLGNPVAVVLDAEGLDDATMARFANWTNLSETTFVLPPTTSEADYRVRIFTASEELPFAGHPTLGTCRALIDAGVIPDRGRWVQECAAGLIELLGGDGVLSFAAPPARVSAAPIDDDTLAAVLGGRRPADPLLIDVGPRWLTGRLDLADLDSLRVDATAFERELDPKVSVGINLYAVDEEQRVHVRSFFVAAGVVTEDPVCGSGNASVGVHLVHTGGRRDVPARYEARQGRHRGRDGRIQVTLGETASDPVRVGGPAVTVVTGSVKLSESGA